MRLSIIVTVYNKYAYLRKCLDSCVLQQDVSPEDYEIVVINDGSEDDSLSIIQEYSLKYPQLIKVIDQTNSGLSVSRNNGVKASSGDYIWFVDADDWIAPDAVSAILSASGSVPDVIPIQATDVGSGVASNDIPISAHSGSDVLMSGNWCHCSQYFIVCRDFWTKNDFSFYPGIYHEDSELTPKILYKADTVAVIDRILYFRCLVPESITVEPRIKRSYDYLKVANSLYDFLKRNIHEESLQGVFYHTISIMLNNSLANILSFDSEKRRQFCSEMYENRHLFTCLSKSTMKYRIESVLFRVFPRHTVMTYRLLKLL